MNGEIVELLFCPSCKGDLEFNSFEEAGLICSSCQKLIPKLGNAFSFLAESTPKELSRTDMLDRLKAKMKSYPRLYEIGLNLFAPVYWNKKSLRRFLAFATLNNLKIINVGSGPSDLGPNVLNTDFFLYPNVDLVADMHKLPIKSNSFDRVVSLAVLEHTPTPNIAVSEIFRILRPEGEVLCFFPFIQGFHASPNDFTRVTSEGLKVLFENFIIEEIETIGPTSALLWVAQEWVCTLLSFGNRQIHNYFFVLILLLSWPLKFLDIFLANNKLVNNIPSGYVIRAKKPSSSN